MIDLSITARCSGARPVVPIIRFTPHLAAIGAFTAVAIAAVKSIRTSTWFFFKTASRSLTSDIWIPRLPTRANSPTSFPKLLMSKAATSRISGKQVIVSTIKEPILPQAPSTAALIIP